MADNTGIEWCDESWNPVTGCTKVSPGCDNCYAEAMTNRFKRGPFEEVKLHSDRLQQPFSWQKPRMIFVCSMGDLFHSAVPWEFTRSIFQVMQLTLRHTYQVLTKRPGRMAWFAENILNGDWPSNVWAGTSVESQKYAPRLDVLARVPAQVRFVSVEPLLGPVELRPWLGLDAEVVAHGPLNSDMARALVDVGKAAARKVYGIQWVIAGGESGPKARPMHPEWARQIRDDCQAAGVPFFFKQWGEWAPGENVAKHHGIVRTADWFDDCWLYGTEDLASEGGHIDDEPDLYRIGKKAAGDMLDGREHREMPQELAHASQ